MREVIEGQPGSRSSAVRSRSHLPALTKGTFPAAFDPDSSAKLSFLCALFVYLPRLCG